MSSTLLTEAIANPNCCIIHGKLTLCLLLLITISNILLQHTSRSEIVYICKLINFIYFDLMALSNIGIIVVTQLLSAQ